MENQKRLIDANALRDKLQNITADVCQEICDGFYKLGMSKPLVYLAIAETTTIDAVEVVHGRWEWYTDRCEDLFLGCDDDYGWRCSKCKVPLDDEDDPEVMPTFRYCPNCGAKMDG